MVQSHLLFADLHDSFFYGIRRHELEAKNLFLLSNSMSTRQGLNILMRVEVWIEDDHGICCSKIDANTASSCRKQKREDGRFGCIEGINAPLLLQTTNAAIKTAEIEAQATEEILNDI
ncbi:hypothetical protein HG530_013460 [Fusarium avenaceum]|nr:hypothetical protein HG530_013460 [Fusarium avenaceum]